MKPILLILMLIIMMNTKMIFGHLAPGPLKVFILAGQSNMEGQGIVDKGNGSCAACVKDPRTAKDFAELVDNHGNWTIRDDVWIWYNEGGHGKLSVGYGFKSNKVGPELGFGMVVGDGLKEQVLVVKTAWGGKSLGVDFRPPSSGGTVGPYYLEMVQDIHQVLANLTNLFPDYDSTRGYRIIGLGWHQGWNDGCSADLVKEYELNLVNLIKDLRNELGSTLLFSIPISGFGGWNQTIDRRLGIMQAQLNVGNWTLYPEFQNNVVSEETRDFWRTAEESPCNQGYHWNCNCESYYNIGKAMGIGMLGLINGSLPNNLSNASPVPGKSTHLGWNSQYFSPEDSAFDESICYIEQTFKQQSGEE